MGRALGAQGAAASRPLCRFATSPRFAGRVNTGPALQRQATRWPVVDRGRTPEMRFGPPLKKQATHASLTRLAVPASHPLPGGEGKAPGQAVQSAMNIGSVGAGRRRSCLSPPGKGGVGEDNDGKGLIRGSSRRAGTRPAPTEAGAPPPPVDNGAAPALKQPSP
jgi:hypothetical protein